MSGPSSTQDMMPKATALVHNGLIARDTRRVPESDRQFESKSKVINFQRLDDRHGARAVVTTALAARPVYPRIAAGLRRYQGRHRWAMTGRSLEGPELRNAAATSPRG
jgi:hypothetical protein